MESRVRDTADQSMESRGSDIRHMVVEEQSLGVNNFVAQVGRSENVGFASVAHSRAGDIVTGQPIEDTKDEVKLPVSGILDKSDAQNDGTAETMLRIYGGSNSRERLQMGKAPQLDSRNVMHGDHTSHNGAESWSVGYGFETGDMVWGKVKSHPWWPGHIFNEAFASPSVRHTKKDGQVLVAFFGDSSYGWFDPAELIPYELHFNEKSQQSTSRNFVKAVEESVDEACRRSALGLTCFCRSPYNFRPTNVRGHMAVDVFDYEPGGIYSHDQIQKARDNFLPEQTLSFIEQLAAAAQKATTSLDFVREKAISVAFRRAVFEEFDETYAQAFGQEPVRPIVAPPPSVDQSVQANLSGPLVIAESLSSHRSSTKTVQSKEHSKKDRYLFKRRGEASDVVTCHIGQGYSGSSSSFAYEDEQSHAKAGDYVFQRRDQGVFSRNQLEGATCAKDAAAAASSLGLSKADQERAVAEGTGAAKEYDPSSNKSKKASALKGGASKRLSAAQKSDLGVKKKKRKSIDSPGSSSGLPGRPIQIGAPSRSDSHQPKGVSTTSFSGPSDQVPVVPSGAGAQINESELKDVLADLKDLALNPLHGRDGNSPALAQQVFLRFRSQVFQKSLPPLPPPASASGADKEAFEARSTKSSSSHPTPGESTRTSRPPKLLLGKRTTTDDPTRGGGGGGRRKRVLSERQEDIAAKRAKKQLSSAVKSAVASSTEKRKAPPEPETQHPDGERRKGLASMKVVRVKEPTFLVMKYPPGISLPSSAELKARFGRFGPMDPSQNRIFYTTNMCRILFLYKEDAQSAYRFGIGNKSPFSNVRFMLKPHLVAQDPQAAASGGKASNNNSKAGLGEDDHHLLQPTPPSPAVQQQLKSCLKKKPSPAAGDEGGSQKNSGGGARVRFNMAMGETMMDPRTKTNSSSLPEASSGSSSSSSSSSLSSVVANNQQQKVFLKHPLQLQPPLVPSPVPVPFSNVHTYATRLPPPPSSPPAVDISQQMLSLLARCNDVVTNVKSVLGYVPYYPL